jgi:hypothetical protein
MKSQADTIPKQKTTEIAIKKSLNRKLSFQKKKKKKKFKIVQLMRSLT